MTYRLAIFDLDGTILDTLEDLTDSVNFALSKHELPTRSMDEVRAFVGNGIRLLIERAVPVDTNIKTIDKVFESFKDYYGKHCADKTKPYDGIRDCLKALRENGIKTAVVSNKADFAVKDLCIQYFDGLFDIAVGEREGILKKPAPDSVNEVLKVLGVDRKEAVYIGDSDVDVQTAANADMDCIAVTWGFRSKEVLSDAGARAFADNAYELKNIVINN